MFVRNHYLGDGTVSISGPSLAYHILGVDNIVRAFNPPFHMIDYTTPWGVTMKNAVASYDAPPLQGDKPGFNMVIRVATGAYEYIVQGMSHPDSAAALSASKAVSNVPSNLTYNAASQGAAPASPAVTVSYGAGNFVDVPPTVQSSGYSTVTPTMSVQTEPTSEAPKSNGALWAILAAGAAFIFGQ